MEAYAFNGSRFAYETFAEEIVVVSLADGTYYAFGGAAVDIWAALIKATPIGEIARAYSGDRTSTEAAADIEAFVARLVDEGMIVPAKAASGHVMAARDAGRGYRPISFEKHTDLQDLLTLDPIHDVDPQRGWPNS